MADAAQQRAYLQAMGIQPWVRRELAVPVIASEAATDVASAAPEIDSPVPDVVVPGVAADTLTDEPLTAASIVIEAGLQASLPSPEMPADSSEPDISDPPALAPVPAGVSVVAVSGAENLAESVTKAAASTTEVAVTPVAATPTVSSDATASTAAETTISTFDWQTLQAAVSQCTRCGLHASRGQAVLGSGDRRAQWLIVGEAPGEDEDQQGEPFVGASGQLLNNMLRATGLSREQVYLTNVIKCHPPKDRNPHVDEINQCFDYLQRQVALVRPRLILAVGRVAAHALLKVNTPLGELRGQVHQFADIPLVVTYHPAYLLRKPFEKAKSWDDLRLARRLVAEAKA